jgi:hypothetical protein
VFAAVGPCRDLAATGNVSEAELVVTTTTKHICSIAYFMKSDLQGNISNGAIALAVGHPTAISKCSQKSYFTPGAEPEP